MIYISSPQSDCPICFQEVKANSAQWYIHKDIRWTGTISTAFLEIWNHDLLKPFRGDPGIIPRDENMDGAGLFEEELLVENAAKPTA